MSTNSLEINLTTLTPIWTGGADGKCDRLHVTGIIGSLRWWYEVIVRGLGGQACDPSEHSCLYDKEKSHDGLCDVCRVFGTTGWARRFRLTVSDERQLEHKDPSKPTIDPTKSIIFPVPSRKHPISPKSSDTKTPTWYLSSAPLYGRTDIKLLATNTQFQIEIIGGLIQFLADWASIGAKPQMGLGIVEVSPRQGIQHFINHLQTITDSGTNPILPSLRVMFFTDVKTATSSIEETFNLKYDLRRLFATNKDLRHFTMGTVKNERRGTKIMISRPYANNTLRIWGWVPEEVTRFDTTRDQVIQQIHSYLRTNYTINHWREFNSVRDMVSQNYLSPKEFLSSLLKREGRKT